MDTFPHPSHRGTQAGKVTFGYCCRTGITRRLRGSIAMGILLWCFGAVEAQHPPSGPVDRGSHSSATTTVYSDAYFAHYEVLTATDMVLRIPGASTVLNAAEDADTARGFGSSGDQILINGRRIAGKSNEIVAVLGRIQASLVDRVELIRGISPDIEVRSDGLIVNIVLREGVTTGSVTTWRAGAVHLLEKETRPAGSVSHGGDRGPLTYVVGAELSRPLLSRQIRPHEFFAPDGNLIVTQDEIRYEHDRQADVSGGLLYRLGRGEMRLNGLLQRFDQVLDEPRDVYDVDPFGTRFFRGTDARRVNTRSHRWEVGGDYQQRLSSDARLNALFVYSSMDDDVVQVQTEQDAGVERLVSLEQTEAAWREAIVRSSIQWPLRASQNIEVGAEVALNTLDTDFQLFAEEDGETIQVDLFNADSKVREVRWQAFSIYSWDLASSWSLQTALNAEISEISQVGADVSLDRRFTFLKPRVDLHYQWTHQRRLRLRAEKTVSQLEFDNFVASYDFDDEQLRAGNPNLVPEEVWEYEIALSQQIRDDGGTFDIRLYYHDIDNLIDRVPATPTRSMRGNLDGARRLGGEIAVGLRLDRVGLPDVMVNAAYLYEKAEVTDPLTGERRNFTADAPYEWNLGFRHDIASPRVSYGMELAELGPRSTHEVTWDRKFRSYVEMTAFLEARVWQSMSLMVEGRMLRWDRGERDQRRFVVNRGDGELRRTEWMHRRATPALTVSLRGAF